MEAGKKESASASESAASVGGGQRHILQGPLGKVGGKVERASGHRRDSARATSELGEAVINNAMIYEGDEGRGQRQGTVLTQWCTFLEQEVREKRLTVCCAAVRVSPSLLRLSRTKLQFAIQKITHLNTLWTNA